MENRCMFCGKEWALYRCETPEGVIVICCLLCAVENGYKIVEEVEE